MKRITPVYAVTEVDGKVITSKSVRFGLNKIKRIDKIGDGATYTQFTIDELTDKRYKATVAFDTAAELIKTFKTPQQHGVSGTVTGLTFTGTEDVDHEVTFNETKFTVTQGNGGVSISNIATGAGTFTYTPQGTVTGAAIVDREHKNIPITLQDSNTLKYHKIWTDDITKVVITGTTGIVHYKKGVEIKEVYYTTISGAVSEIDKDE